MRKCLFIINGLGQGGLETYLLRFLRYTHSRFYNIVWCKTGESDVLYNEYKEVANEIILEPLGFFSITDYARLYKYLKNNKIDTVCDFTGNFAGLTLTCAYFANVKKRISFYRGSTNHFNETKLRLIYNSLMRNLVSLFSTKILSNSQAALDFFYPSRDYNDKKFKVIYNDLGIEYLQQHSDETKESVRAKLHLSADTFVIGHVGRYNVAKNHETIIKVAEMLCKQYSDIVFVLIGKGTDIYLKEYVKYIGLQNQILCLGYRSDVTSLLKAFDLFYFPSITEGQPNALIEAMVSGIPFIASNITPIKESIPVELHEKLLFPTDVNLAVEYIRRLYYNRSLLTEFSCQEWAVDNYCSNKWFNEFFNEL